MNVANNTFDKKKNRPQKYTDEHSTKFKVETAEIQRCSLFIESAFFYIFLTSIIWIILSSATPFINVLLKSHSIPAASYLLNIFNSYPIPIFNDGYWYGFFPNVYDQQNLLSKKSCVLIRLYYVFNRVISVELNAINTRCV